ncbi:glycosylinositol phosphorylceramide mannosyl transferase 1-like [Aristolochia californica]|uniref:glycosylinositol phosphorylceramide mannosyl transferase 1-like n=1 Tax=Aristolochia californica TaxID=171875 RepID=UPI0035D5E3FC
MRGNSYSRRFLLRFRQLLISAASVKIKLLLTCCIAFTFFLIAGRTASFMGWRHRHSPTGSSPSRPGFTIVVNTWKRNDLLKKSIAHYSACLCVDSIHIVWSESEPPSDSLHRVLRHIVQSNSRDGRHIELKFDIHKEDSLNNRFKEIPDLKTEAVFSIDDDVIFPCTSVEFAFKVWQSAPAAMVGFVPRMHWLDKSMSKSETYSYGGWWSVWWMGRYSMVLSKAAFFHKKYLELYTNHMPASIRDYITKNRNCEDIAMAFLVANATRAPPIWVKGNIFEIGSTGISSLGGHSERRSVCVNKFAEVYGYMPLVSTSVKAVDSRNLWLW